LASRLRRQSFLFFQLLGEINAEWVTAQEVVPVYHLP
jgi:hypothetical protein